MRAGLPGVIWGCWAWISARSAAVLRVYRTDRPGDLFRSEVGAERFGDLDGAVVLLVGLEERDKDQVCIDFGVDRDYLRVLLHRAKQSFKSLYLKNVAARPPGALAAGKR